MALTQNQYRTLQRVQRVEELAVKRQQKINVLGTYLTQAQEVVRLLAISNDLVFANPQDAVRRFAEIDLVINQFDDQIVPDLLSAENQMIELSADQTLQILRLANYSFRFTGEFVSSTKNLIDDTRRYRDGKFQLSSAIWGEKNRDQFYKQILDDINAGKPRNEITKALEDRLLKTGNGGQFYNVERVLDTELNRTYGISKLEATRAWNQESTDPMLYGRRVSSAHKVPDICDEIAGVYSAESEVPSDPHPNDMCIKFQVFRSDHKGKVKTLKSSNGIFKSSKYKDQQTFVI